MIFSTVELRKKWYYLYLLVGLLQKIKRQLLWSYTILTMEVLDLDFGELLFISYIGWKFVGYV